MNTTQKGNSTELLMDDSRIKFYGRTNRTKLGAWLDWSASGFEVNVRGGFVSATITAEACDDRNCVYVAVYINGKHTRSFRLGSGTQQYDLTRELPAEKEYNVRLMKITEAQLGTAIVKRITVTGELLPRSEDRERKVLWIGDSITTGLGLLASPSETFSSKNSDITFTVPFLLSEQWKADYHILAASGFGVATSNEGSTDEGLISMIFDLTSGLRSTTVRWDHRQFQPDLVVVNLGTGDVAGGSSAARLQAGIAAFLTKLRQEYPQAILVWTYGAMQTVMLEEIRATVETFSALDGNAYFIPMATISGWEETGAAGHPNKAANWRMAADFAEKLRKQTPLDW